MAHTQTDSRFIKPPLKPRGWGESTAAPLDLMGQARSSARSRLAELEQELAAVIAGGAATSDMREKLTATREINRLEAEIARLRSSLASPPQPAASAPKRVAMTPGQREVAARHRLGEAKAELAEVVKRGAESRDSTVKWEAIKRISELKETIRLCERELFPGVPQTNEMAQQLLDQIHALTKEGAASDSDQVKLGNAVKVSKLKYELLTKYGVVG